MHKAIFPLTNVEPLKHFQKICLNCYSQLLCKSCLVGCTLVHKDLIMKHLNLSSQDLKPGHYLKDTERLNYTEQQLSAPRPVKECSTPQPEEPLQINMPTPTCPPTTTQPATVPTPTPPASVMAPPQPQFAYQEINTLSMAGLTPHIQINETVGWGGPLGSITCILDLMMVSLFCGR